MRESSSNRVYTYTYNESPMSKELERGQIKNTVVRSTRLYDPSSGQQPMSKAHAKLANFSSTGDTRNSNPSPLIAARPKLPSPSRYTVAKRSGQGTFKVASDYNSQQCTFLPRNHDNTIQQPSPTSLQKRWLRPSIPDDSSKPSDNRYGNDEGDSDIGGNTPLSPGDGAPWVESYPQKGMFNNLMRTIGTMFTATNSQQEPQE